MAAQRTIGNYRFEEKLGSGGMGVVHRAFDLVLERSVAIKMMHGSEMLGDVDVNEIQERFLREARAAARIKSRHIAQVLQMGRSDDGDAYIVMELLDGIALNKELHRVGRMPVARALHIGKQICKGMSAAHELGVVHRDLKPANVMLVEEEGDPDFVKVLDFGIAKLADGRNGLTQTGALLGTLPFMAPEQISGKDIDRRVDIYSLGILLYRMITGTPLFDAENLSDVVRQQLVVPPQPMAERLGPLIPISPILDAVVLRCLEKDRERRFSTMMELFQALQSVTGAPTETITGNTPQQPMFAPTVPMMPLRGATTPNVDVQSGAAAPTGAGTTPTNASARWSFDDPAGAQEFEATSVFGPGVMPASAVSTLRSPDMIAPAQLPASDGVTRSLPAPISLPAVTRTMPHLVEDERGPPAAGIALWKGALAASLAALLTIGIILAVLSRRSPSLDNPVAVALVVPETGVVAPVASVPVVETPVVDAPVVDPPVVNAPVVVDAPVVNAPVKPAPKPKKKDKDKDVVKVPPPDDGFVRVHTKEGT
jgi:serine/threonine protein kinase